MSVFEGQTQTTKLMSWEYFLIKLRPNSLEYPKHRQLRGSDGLSYLVFMETSKMNLGHAVMIPRQRKLGVLPAILFIGGQISVVSEKFQDMTQLMCHSKYLRIALIWLWGATFGMLHLLPTRMAGWIYSRNIGVFCLCVCLVFFPINICNVGI